MSDEDKEGMYEDLFRDLRHYLGEFDSEEILEEAFDEDLWTET